MKKITAKFKKIVKDEIKKLIEYDKLDKKNRDIVLKETYEKFVLNKLQFFNDTFSETAHERDFIQLENCIKDCLPKGDDELIFNFSKELK